MAEIGHCDLTAIQNIFGCLHAFFAYDPKPCERETQNAPFAQSRVEQFAEMPFVTRRKAGAPCHSADPQN